MTIRNVPSVLRRLEKTVALEIATIVKLFESFKNSLFLGIMDKHIMLVYD